MIHTGSVTPPPPVTLACSANPETVYPGDPVTVTASAGGLNPKENVIYSWSGTGVTGNDTTAKVDTGSLAPGEYSVQGTVKEGRKGKEGLRPWETANCTAGITVKAYEPPTISCSVSPTTIKPGESATITSTAVSPAESSAHLQLLRLGGHHLGDRDHRGILLSRRSDGRSWDHVQCFGR